MSYRVIDASLFPGSFLYIVGPVWPVKAGRYVQFTGGAKTKMGKIPGDTSSVTYVRGYVPPTAKSGPATYYQDNIPVFKFYFTLKAVPLEGFDAPTIFTHQNVVGAIGLYWVWKYLIMRTP